MSFWKHRFVCFPQNEMVASFSQFTALWVCGWNSNPVRDTQWNRVGVWGGGLSGWERRDSWHCWAQGIIYPKNSESIHWRHLCIVCYSHQESHWLRSFIPVTFWGLDSFITLPGQLIFPPNTDCAARDQNRNLNNQKAVLPLLLLKTFADICIWISTSLQTGGEMSGYFITFPCFIST